MTFKDELLYIKRNYGDIPTRLIAEDLGRSTYWVHRRAKDMNIRISPAVLRNLKKVRKKPNPNPITATTKMLICKYYSEGSSIAHISYLLGRPKAVIEAILKSERKKLRNIS